MTQYDRRIDSPARLSEVIAEISREKISDSNGNLVNNFYYDPSWPSAIIPGLFDLIPPFETNSLPNRSPRKLAEEIGILHLAHREMAGDSKVHSKLFLDLTPDSFINAVEMAFLRNMSRDERLVLSVLADRRDDLPGYMRSSIDPALFRMVRPTVVFLLSERFNGNDLSGDRLVLMYQGQRERSLK